MPMSRLRLPSLNALRAFEAAARHVTLARAAEELHVTHGAVSRQIRLLEEELGEDLFLRDGRGKALNPRGHLLAGRLHEIFADLAQAIDDFRQDDVMQPLSISCEPTLCLKMLIRDLGALKRETGLDVKLFAAGGPVDFARDRIDLAIRRDDFPIPNDLYVHPLADEATGPVLSPRMADDRPVSDFRRLPQLHSMTRPDAWRDWFRRTGVRPVRAKREIFEHFYLALEAAQAGHGVALASVYMAAGDIAAGLLVAPRRFVPDGTRYVCLSREPFDRDPRRRLFASWLTRRMERLSRAFVGDDPGGDGSERDDSGARS